MRDRLTKLGRWLVYFAVATFIANIGYFFLLMSSGSRDKNAMTDQVILLNDHGAVVFVTPSQYYSFVGTLIFAGVLFITGAVVFARSRTGRAKASGGGLGGQ
jgi:hypothetical protein